MQADMQRAKARVEWNLLVGKTHSDPVGKKEQLEQSNQKFNVAVQTAQLHTEPTTSAKSFFSRVIQRLCLRPQLLQQSGQQHDYVFFKKNGTAPRADFGELTSTATMQTIRQAKNPHAFRSAVVTAFYTKTGATQSDMNTLAQIMAHDPLTARNCYYRPQMAQAASETNARMRKVLQLTTDSEVVMQHKSAADVRQDQPGEHTDTEHIKSTRQQLVHDQLNVDVHDLQAFACTPAD
jgi:hypothetical protein